MYDNFTKQQDGQKPVILFTNLPPLNQLFAISVKITNSSNSVQAFSNVQPQVIKCREFIFTEPEVIGTPSADIRDNCFHLIAQASVMKSGRIQARINRVGLQVTKPYQVTPDLYQACLKYTLQARISPNWNKAGQWFLQGRDFLTLTGCVNGIKMDITMNQSELFFTLEATAFKTSPLQVTDLDITTTKLNNFLGDRSAQINRHDIGSDWCFILPSMKKGRIIGITHDVPEECPFSSYRDLKRHWKNMYGYRLPEDDEGLKYYQICFGSFGGKLFTYPEVCLRGRDLHRLSRIDPKPIMRAFMQDVQSRFPTVCGFPLKLQSKAKFTSNDLQTCLKATTPHPPNLTTKIGSTRPALYRSKEDMNKLVNTNSYQFPKYTIQPAVSQSNYSKTNINQNNCNANMSFNQCENVLRQNVCLMKTNHQVDASSSASTTPYKSQFIQQLQQTQSSGRNFEAQQTQSSGRKFEAQQTQGSGRNFVAQQTQSSGRKFEAQQTLGSGGDFEAQQTQSSKRDFEAQKRSGETPTHNTMNQQNNATVKKLFPSFNAKKNLFLKAQPNQNIGQKSVPRFTPKKRPFEIVSASSAARTCSYSTESNPSCSTGVNSSSFGKPVDVTRTCSSVYFKNIPSSKPLNVCSENLVNKITPRFFQKKLPTSQTPKAQASSMIKSKPATKDGTEKHKKPAKRAKAVKDGTGANAKKRKLKKAEA